MYFIELIIKKLTKKREQTDNFNPVSENENPDYEACEHNFMPLDSTGEVLSCTKCGIIAQKSELKDKNFFATKNPFTF